MRIIHLASVAPLLLLAAGCYTHPRYAAVQVSPHEMVVVPAPTSDRPVMRVYPAPVTTTITPGVSTTEHAIADSIRNMFNADPAWSGLTDHVEVRVSGTRVDLSGVVASDSIRGRIEEKIRSIPSVTQVVNGLRVVTP